MEIVKIALLVLVIGVAFVASECAQECQNGGTCSTALDRCVCTGNWKGTDCTIYDQALNSGETATASMTTSQWRYFNHRVGHAGVRLVWTVNQTNSDDDCDLFVQYENYPRITEGGFVASDDTANQNVTLTLEGVRAGTYYAGVYSYSPQCSFTISVREDAACVDSCNNHGQCIQGVCQCYSGYSGPMCQYTIRQLMNGTTLMSEVQENAFDYYYTDIRTSGDGLRYTMTQLGDVFGDDCDMFLALNRMPSMFDYDAANTSASDDTTLYLSSATAGRYQLAIYGYTRCTYSIKAEIIASPTCPNKCSLHGRCMLNTICQCDNGFEGEICEWMEPSLPLDTQMSGYVGSRTWNYYNFRVLTDNAVTVYITQKEDQPAGADCDLYLRANDKPTRFEYDLLDLSLNSEYHVTVQAPQDSLWYIGVFGWENCEYTVEIKEGMSCSCGDSSHGHCEEGSSTCVCDIGYGGEDCSVRTNILSNLTPVTGSVRKYEWSYYIFPVNASTTGVVTLKEKSTQGMLWMFVSFVDYPSLSIYDMSERKTNSQYHEIQIFVNTPQTRDVYIGVYGSPYYVQDNVDLEFSLVTWSAPF